MARPRRAVTWIILVNVVIYLFELGYAYAVGFRPDRVRDFLDVVSLSNEGLASGRVWQVVTHAFVHSLDSPFHVVFNVLVLFWFGRELESRWGARRFVLRYALFGLGGVLASVLFGLVSDAPTLGASGAVFGVLTSFCILYWRTPLRLLFLELQGRFWLLIFVALDLLRLASGDPIAVEMHWGGGLMAAALMHPDVLSPKLAWLRLKRWRLKRRLRIEPGGKSNGDSRYLH